MTNTEIRLSIHEAEKREVQNPPYARRRPMGAVHKALADAVKRGLLFRSVTDAVDAPRP